jgi:enterobactin synthetase component D
MTGETAPQAPDDCPDADWWDARLALALGLPATVHLTAMATSAAAVINPILCAVPISLPDELVNASPKRKDEFVAGRRCALNALHTGGCESTTAPGMDAGRLPLWPADWRGCITHSNGEAIAVVSRTADTRLLGIDVEKLIDPTSVDGIGALVALESELALFAGMTQSQALTILFSAKETLYKALYPETRRFMEFSAVRLTGVSPLCAGAGGLLTVRLSEDWDRAWRAGHQLTLRYALRRDRVYTVLHTPQERFPAA